MAELADARDSKSRLAYPRCGFESHLRQLNGDQETSWTVYVLRSLKNGWFYIGMTGDLHRRIREHNAGYNTSTKGKGPFVLLHSQSFRTRQQARQEERRLKTGSGRECLRRLYG